MRKKIEHQQRKARERAEQESAIDEGFDVAFTVPQALFPNEGNPTEGGEVEDSPTRSPARGGSRCTVGAEPTSAATGATATASMASGNKSSGEDYAESEAEDVLGVAPSSFDLSRARLHQTQRTGRSRRAPLMRGSMWPSQSHRRCSPTRAIPLKEGRWRIVLPGHQQGAVRGALWAPSLPLRPQGPQPLPPWHPATRAAARTTLSLRLRTSSGWRHPRSIFPGPDCTRLSGLMSFMTRQLYLAKRMSSRLHGKRTRQITGLGWWQLMSKGMGGKGSSGNDTGGRQKTWPRLSWRGRRQGGWRP